MGSRRRSLDQAAVDAFGEVEAGELDDRRVAGRDFDLVLLDGVLVDWELDPDPLALLIAEVRHAAASLSRTSAGRSRLRAQLRDRQVRRVRLADVDRDELDVLARRKSESLGRHPAAWKSETRKMRRSPQPASLGALRPAQRLDVIGPAQARLGRVEGGLSCPPSRVKRLATV